MVMKMLMTGCKGKDKYGGCSYQHRWHNHDDGDDDDDVDVVD